jgi:hypothetical protein
MILDRVTSLADLAFRGKTDRLYRQLAIITASYYGRPDLTWKEAMLFLNKVSVEGNPCSCANVVRDVNYNRELVKNDFVERPEQMELDEQDKKKVISYSDWLEKKRAEELDNWYGYQYIDNRDCYYRTNT